MQRREEMKICRGLKKERKEKGTEHVENCKEFRNVDT